MIASNATFAQINEKTPRVTIDPLLDRQRFLFFRTPVDKQVNFDPQTLTRNTFAIGEQ